MLLPSARIGDGVSSKRAADLLGGAFSMGTLAAGGSSDGCRGSID